MENIYDIRTGYDIEHFIFHDFSRYQAYRASSNAHDSMESLFIRETADGLDLSLYLDINTVHQLKNDNPFHNLHQGNLTAFCLAAEGISHFVYLIWNATHLRPVTQLELELQAEVDKYILCASILASQSNGTLPKNLCELLFAGISFNPELTVEQLQRYQLANQYAGHYCNNLHFRMLNYGESHLVTKEIRRFYRLWHEHKVKRINAIQ